MGKKNKKADKRYYCPQFWHTMQGWIDLSDLATTSKKLALVSAKNHAESRRVITRVIRKSWSWEPNKTEVSLENVSRTSSHSFTEEEKSDRKRATDLIVIDWVGVFNDMLEERGFQFKFGTREVCSSGEYPVYFQDSDQDDRFWELRTWDDWCVLEEFLRKKFEEAQKEYTSEVHECFWRLCLEMLKRV